jgi:seryl-tRNA synthetase
MKVDRLEEKLKTVQQCIAGRQERVAKIAGLIDGLKSAKTLAPNVAEEAEEHLAQLKHLRKKEKELTCDLEKVLLKFPVEEEEKPRKTKKK